MKWFAIVLLFAAVFADVYIYRSVVCCNFHRLPGRVAYIVFALLTNGAAVAALVAISRSGTPSDALMVTVMWLAWVFFLATLPKLLFAAGGALDFVVSLIVHHRVLAFRGAALALSLVAVAAMVWGATVGRTKPRVVEVEVCSPRVPEAFDGYRIAQISDIHLGTMPRVERRLANLVDEIAALGADMVVHTGDLVNMLHSDLTDEAAAQLSRLRAADGVWLVWGNHDLGFYARDPEVTPAENLSLLDEKVRRMGWGTLLNRSVLVRRGEDSILLSGVGYPRRDRLGSHPGRLGAANLEETFAGIESDPFNVVLSHTPELWRAITAAGRGDLTLSGHTHAMQLKLSLFGVRWSPAQYMYGEWSGATVAEDEKNSTLYVNDGIGCVGYPMRIGARPEVTLFILKRCE